MRYVRRHELSSWRYWKSIALDRLLNDDKKTFYFEMHEVIRSDTKLLLSKLTPIHLQKITESSQRIADICREIQTERLQDIMTLKCPECEHGEIVGVHNYPGDKIPDEQRSPVWAMCKACYHIMGT